jgi:hypothetical protein
MVIPIPIENSEEPDILWKSGEDAHINALGIIGISYHEDEVAEIEIRLPLGAKITYKVVGTK